LRRTHSSIATTTANTPHSAQNAQLAVERHAEVDAEQAGDERERDEDDRDQRQHVEALVRQLGEPRRELLW
jgi:hypothetical protein